MSQISIGIPVYNQASTIAATIESALAQTLPAHEVVVSENHSTDGTAEIVARYKDRVRIVRPPRHTNAMENWNFCSDNIRSPWFSLLSGDDLAKPCYIAAMEAAITLQPDAVLVRGDWEVINDQGAVIRTQRLLSVKRVTLPPHSLREQLCGPKVCFAAFTLKKEAWGRAGKFNERMLLNGDWAMWLAVAPLGPVVHAAEIIAGYREVSRPGLELKRLPQRIQDEHYTFLEIYRRLQEQWGLADDIRRAKRERYIDLLRYCGCFPADTLRAEDHSRLLEMAVNAGLDEIYTRWRADPADLPKSLLSGLRVRARRLARSVVERLRSR